MTRRNMRTPRDIPDWSVISIKGVQGQLIRNAHGHPFIMPATGQPVPIDNDVLVYVVIDSQADNLALEAPPRRGCWGWLRTAFSKPKQKEEVWEYD